MYNNIIANKVNKSFYKQIFYLYNIPTYKQTIDKKDEKNKGHLADNIKQRLLLMNE